jgi:hypothetical protein
MAVTALTSLTEDQYVAIGHIAVNWAELENTFMFTLWGICKLDFTHGVALTAHMSHLARIGALQAILSEQYPEQTVESDITEFISRSEMLRTERNLVIHGRWSMAGNNSSRVITHTARKKLAFKNEVFTLERMVNLANDIKHIERDITKYLINNDLFPDLS